MHRRNKALCLALPCHMVAFLLLKIRPAQCDSCPDESNPDQADQDGDETGDLCDNCLEQPNPDQSDVDGNEIGDVCDTGVVWRGAQWKACSCDAGPGSGVDPTGPLALLLLLLMHLGLWRRQACRDGRPS